jgi:recombinational DNA repair protein RecR
MEIIALLEGVVCIENVRLWIRKIARGSPLVGRMDYIDQTEVLESRKKSEDRDVNVV